MENIVVIFVTMVVVVGISFVFCFYVATAKNIMQCFIMKVLPSNHLTRNKDKVVIY